MPIYLFKSILSIFVALSALLAVFSMFEVFGRAERKFSVGRMTRLHKINGYFFLLLSIFIAYLCLKILMGTRGELSSRAVFHSVFALSVFLLLALKIVINRFYRQFYGQLRPLGLVLALLAFGLVGTSGGYYMVVTKLGTDLTIDRALGRGAEPARKARLGPSEKPAEPIKISSDPEDIRLGKELYEAECTLCHDPNSRETIIGPGHKGLLKRDKLPVSGRPATAENIAKQLRNPYNRMPSFDYLSDEEINDLLAYLNTL
jgi:mono/diheme cytochrome c family protein